MVRPTICGRIIERRDQVLIGLRSFFSTATSIFFSQVKIDKRTFFQRTRHCRIPLITCGDGQSCCRYACSYGSSHPWSGSPTATPDDDHRRVRPSPPPCGWSTGFMATPRTVGRTPRQRLAPALPRERRLCSEFGYFTQGCTALGENLAHLAGAQTQGDVGTFAGYQLGGSTSGTSDLSAFTRLQLDTVNGANRQGYCAAAGSYRP